MTSRSDNPEDWISAGPGKIELTQEVVPEVVRALFGAVHIAPISNAEMREITAWLHTSEAGVTRQTRVPFRERQPARARRWAAAKYLLRRAFRSGRLRTWLRGRQDEILLDPKYWSHPSCDGSWGWYMAFEHDPRGRPDVRMYILDSREFTAWVSEVVGRRPSRKKPFWTDAKGVAMAWLDAEGFPLPGDGRQAQLEKHIADFLEQRGHDAAESTIRGHVARWIKEFRMRQEAS
jgi:hypothetical protein